MSTPTPNGSHPARAVVVTALTPEIPTIHAHGIFPAPHLPILLVILETIVNRRRINRCARYRRNIVRDVNIGEAILGPCWCFHGCAQADDIGALTVGLFAADATVIDMQPLVAVDEVVVLHAQLFRSSDIRTNEDNYCNWNPWLVKNRWMRVTVLTLTIVSRPPPTIIPICASITVFPSISQPDI